MLPRRTSVPNAKTWIFLEIPGSGTPISLINGACFTAVLTPYDIWRCTHSCGSIPSLSLIWSQQRGFHLNNSARILLHTCNQVIPLVLYYITTITFTSIYFCHTPGKQWALNTRSQPWRFWRSTKVNFGVLTVSGRLTMPSVFLCPSSILFSLLSFYQRKTRHILLVGTRMSNSTAMVRWIM